MSDYKYQMGQRIKAKRKSMNLTQENVSEKIGISVKHFSEVERGIAGLSIENLIKLSDLLSTSIDYIVKGENDEKNWDCVLNSLKRVPEQKDILIKELIDIAIEISQ